MVTDIFSCNPHFNKYKDTSRWYLQLIIFISSRFCVLRSANTKEFWREILMLTWSTMYNITRHMKKMRHGNHLCVINRTKFPFITNRRYKCIKNVYYKIFGTVQFSQANILCSQGPLFENWQYEICRR